MEEGFSADTSFTGIKLLRSIFSFPDSLASKISIIPASVYLSKMIGSFYRETKAGQPKF